MKKLRTLVFCLSLCSLLSSCKSLKEEEVVTDNRFDFSAAVQYDEDNFLYYLELLLLSGNDDDYSLSVMVNGQPLGGLVDDDIVSLTKGVKSAICLLLFGEGSYMMEVSLSHNGVKNTHNVSFEEKEPLNVKLINPVSGKEVSCKSVNVNQLFALSVY